MFDLYFFIQLVLLLLSCLACFYAGKERGIDELITILVGSRIIDNSKLKKLTKILTSK